MDGAPTEHAMQAIQKTLPDHDPNPKRILFWHICIFQGQLNKTYFFLTFWGMSRWFYVGGPDVAKIRNILCFPPEIYINGVYGMHGSKHLAEALWLNSLWPSSSFILYQEKQKTKYIYIYIYIYPPPCHRHAWCVVSLPPAVRPTGDPLRQGTWRRVFQGK